MGAVKQIAPGDEQLDPIVEVVSELPAGLDIAGHARVQIERADPAHVERQPELRGQVHLSADAPEEQARVHEIRLTFGLAASEIWQE